MVVFSYLCIRKDAVQLVQIRAVSAGCLPGVLAVASPLAVAERLCVVGVVCFLRMLGLAISVADSLYLGVQLCDHSLNVIVIKLCTGIF